jgi:F-type H+-transporting ATPase subunit delta
MSEKRTIARPYAKAIFFFAERDGSYVEWLGVLNNLCELVKDTSAINYIKNPTISNKQRSSFISFIYEIFKFSDKEMNLVKLLSKNRRLLFVPDILELYSEYCDEKQGVEKVSVTVASELLEGQYEQILSMLTRYFNRKVDMSYSVDKSIYGGILIKTKGVVVDSTVCGSLFKMRNFLLNEN